MKQIIPLLMLCVPVGGMAQTEVTNYQPGVTIEGVTYYLPRTALRVVVETEKTVVTPGQLAKYAFRYLRMSDVPTESSTTYTIKNITVEPYGVPDESKVFSIELKGRTVAPLVSLTRDGILLSINTKKDETSLSAVPQNKPAAALPDPRQYMNQEILSAGSTAKMAELCAQRIYDTRESRGDLIQGEAANLPKDGNQLQIMIDQLDTQAAALESLFAGTRQTSTEYFVMDYIPMEKTQKDLLFRFSSVAGLVDDDDLSGAPVYISVQSAGSLPAYTENADSDKKKAKLEKGVRYSVPEREIVTVFDTDRQYVSTELSMSQFGNTEILGETLFNKKATTTVTFHQETGAIENIQQ